MLDATNAYSSLPICQACLLSTVTGREFYHASPYCRVGCSFSRTLRVSGRVLEEATHSDRSAQLKWLPIALGTTTLTWTNQSEICQPVPVILPAVVQTTARRRVQPVLANITVACEHIIPSSPPATCPTSSVSCSDVQVTPTPKLVFADGRSRPLLQSRKTKLRRRMSPLLSAPQRHAESTMSTPSGVLPRRSMAFVAHPDDNIIFQSPDMLFDVQAGVPIRVVFLTAGQPEAQRTPRRQSRAEQVVRVVVWIVCTHAICACVLLVAGDNGNAARYWSAWPSARSPNLWVVVVGKSLMCRWCAVVCRVQLVAREARRPRMPSWRTCPMCGTPRRSSSTA